MKTMLVTGGAGFIGSNFIHYMLKKHRLHILNIDKLTYAGNLENLKDIENHPDYTFMQIDICDKDEIYRVFKEYDVQYVVNFAAESHVDRSISEPDIFIRTNVSGTVNLLNASKNAWQIGENLYRKDSKFVQVSTDEVYGSLKPDDPPFTEKTNLDPRSPYSASKAAADFMVNAWASTYGLPVNITRCSNNYGPFQFPEKLIPLIINNALNHKELPVYGDGLQVRDWLYVQDHCSAIELVLCKGKPKETYNIGGGNEHTNLSLIQNILKYLQKNADPSINEGLIRHVKDRKGHDRRYGIDANKVVKELGWRAETSFETGLAKTIDWYLSNKKWMENVTSGSYMDYYDNMYKNR